jgi:Rad3-related DNA helicase
METNKTEIKISVRNLIEFILRTGDIDSGFAGSKRAVDGTRIHRKIQKAQKDNYQAEVSVKHRLEYEKFCLIIEGRIDGIIKNENNYCIDEIKSVIQPLINIDENYNPLHWAQAQCYAYIFATNEHLTTIDVRLTYCEVESEEIKIFTRNYSYAELTEIFNSIINQYLVWANYSYDWQMLRNDSIKTLQFPFSQYRKGQRELAISSYKAVKHKKTLFVKAPTGIGKTISTLFPSLKALGEGHTSKIFYLTAKTITRSVAEETLSLMRQQKIRLKTVTLTAKEKICFKEKVDCHPESCEFACGHFNRINVAIYDILLQNDEFNRNNIEAHARKHQVCPFEFALDLTLWCDVIICDYNYVFDPQVYLKRFFIEKGGDFTFLIDEAHNLVDRARDMFSASLNKSAFSEIKKESSASQTAITKAAGKIIRTINSLKNEHLQEQTSKSIKERPEKLYSDLKKFVVDIEAILLKNRKKENESLLQLYFDALIFIKIAELYDNRYVTFIEKRGTEISVKLFCIDPSFLLSESLKRGRSAILFSATLAPLPYFREILGGAADDPTISLTSPFETENRCLLIASDISTKFNQREQSFRAIVDCITAVIEKKSGNYIVFFPSYVYMNSVAELFRNENPSTKIIVQESSMSETARVDFLNVFQPNPQETTLGFCVLGGMFSEGIDLKSDRLIGAIIVGVGLPQICAERDIIKEYFQTKNNLGFEYAYMYPGMNKVMQAAGRVIRTEQDKGIIILIDTRFTYQHYRNLFPTEWFPHERVISEKIGRYVESFWANESD